MVHAVVDENQSHFGEAHGDIHLYSCQRAERANAVRQLIQSHVGPGDAILFRYPWASAEMLEVVRTFGHQIVFEHNTDEEAEALFALECASNVKCSEWTAFFVEVITDHVVWQARPTVLAAIGSVAGSLRGDVKELPPLPVIHVAGENDPLVKFAWQQATFVAVRRFNHCVDTAKPWAKEGVLEASIYESDRGPPLVTALHPGGHEYPKGSSELIARFFKAQVRPTR